MNNIISNIKGTLSQEFSIGDTTNLVASGSILQIKNVEGELIEVETKSITEESTLNTVATFFNLKSLLPLIEFDFDGSSPPVPGNNLNKFGFCHTSGSIYKDKTIVYDNGISLIQVPFNVVKGIITTTQISGSIVLNSNSIYIKEEDNFILKGGAVNKSFSQYIVVEYSYMDNIIYFRDQLKENTDIISIINKVIEPFSYLSVINVYADKLEPIFSFENMIEEGTYIFEDIYTLQTSSTPFIEIIASGSSQGRGKIYIEYKENN